LGHLQTILTELQNARPGLGVEILGVNRISDAPFNSLIGQMEVAVPWLQDTPEEQVWQRWQIEYRDVLVLDAFNRPVARDNLTSHDLGISLNRAALVGALLQAATPADSDTDGLPDEWEMHWFSNLTPTPGADADSDGADNFNEFTFASSPVDPASHPLLVPYLATPGGSQVLGVSFRRFAGDSASVLVETSPDLLTWTREPTRIYAVGAPRNLADGAGASEVRYQLTAAAGGNPAGFIRVRAVQGAD
jgi:hypothetical protein